MRPLPAIQLITACLIVGSTGRTIFRMNLVRTCSWTGQILLLLRLAGLLAICFRMARRRERLAICAVHGRWLSDTAPDGMRRHKSLSLSRDWREDAVLVESHAVGAAAVLGGLEARASDLQKVSGRSWSIVSHWKYLAASAVAAGNGSTLARSWRLVVLLGILRWRRLLAVWILGRRPTIPFIGAREAVGLLVLRMLVGSHVGSRLLERRREGRAHLG